MIKSKLFTTLSFILILIFAGCSSSNTGEKEVQKISGKIVVIGNEPFTKLALMTSPDKKYVLKCDKLMEDSLLSYQGRNVEVSYGEMKDSSGIDVVTVKDVKFK